MKRHFQAQLSMRQACLGGNQLKAIQDYSHRVFHELCNRKVQLLFIVAFLK